ncbi:MAG: cell division protein SepF [Ilumatobacteraceae bacterium]
MAIWKKAMDYLGLGPDAAYDDYDAEPEPERPARSQRSTREAEAAPRSTRREPDHDTEGTVRTMPSRPTFPQRESEATARRPVPPPDDSNVQPRPINSPRQGSATRILPGPASNDPYTVRPRRFDSAQELADKFKEGLPVIMNLEAADREVSRRLIDFASGLCYGLNGSMEKVATGVYLLKPIAVRQPEYGD